MPLREDERLSAEALKAYLQNCLGYIANWSPVADDPPDLDFSVVFPDGSSERWAVEVTGLFQYVEWEGNAVNRLAFEPRLRKIIEAFSGEHEHEMKLNYGLWVDGPLSVKLLNDLPNRILKYVRSGRTDEVALDHAEAVETVSRNMDVDPKDLMLEVVLQHVAHEYEKIRIGATPGKPGIHMITSIPPVAKIPQSNNMIGDIQESVTFSVNRILDAKLRKMAKLKDFDRRVLLVWSDFVLAEASEVEHALALRNLSITDLDAVFFIDFGWKAVSVVANPADIPCSHS